MHAYTKDCRNAMDPFSDVSGSEYCDMGVDHSV